MNAKLDSRFLLSAAFLLLSLSLTSISGTNPRSRLALGAALCKFSYRINTYIETSSPWTIDWARTPDGSYYSNKAPGASMIAAPVFCAVDCLINRHATTPQERVNRLMANLYGLEELVSLIFQVLPLIFLFHYLCGWLELKTKAATFALGLGLYFATTAAIFMNSWFGHALAAIAVLAAGISIFSRRWVLAGALIGFSLLFDYANAFVFPAFGVAVLLNSRAGGRKTYFAILGRIALGALLPGIFWAHYHIVSFGGLFSLPQKFQNPLFADLTAGPNLWGVLSLPRFSIFMKLLFGSERSLLVSQPWILVCAFTTPYFFRQRRLLRDWYIFAMLSLVGVLFFNASFGQWHGGGTSGPRYLSSALLLFAPLLAMQIDLRRPSSCVRALWWLTLTYSVLLCSVIASTTITAPAGIPLWTALIQHAMERRGTFALRMAHFLLVMSLPVISFVHRGPLIRYSKKTMKVYYLSAIALFLPIFAFGKIDVDAQIISSIARLSTWTEATANQNRPVMELPR